MADVQSDVQLLANLNSLKVPELKKALKDRGVPVAASAKKPDLIAKLKEALTASTSQKPSDEDDFEQQLADITAGKTGVSLQVPSITQIVTSVTSTTGSSNFINKQASANLAYATVTGSSLPRTSTTNTSTTSTANGASTVSGKTSASTTSSSSSSSVKTSSGTNGGSIKKVTAGSSSVHPLDKLAARAARFGSVEDGATSGSSSAKSPTTSIPAATSAQLEALKKRSEKFGESVSPSLKTLEETEKLASRASRFNLPSSSASASKVTLTGGTKRLTSEEDEKLRKRRERFGI